APTALGGPRPVVKFTKHVKESPPSNSLAVRCNTRPDRADRRGRNWSGRDCLGSARHVGRADRPLLGTFPPPPPGSSRMASFRLGYGYANAVSHPNASKTFETRHHGIVLWEEEGRTDLRDASIQWRGRQGRQWSSPSCDG